MSIYRTHSILIVALAAMAQSAYGQQPPDVVASDSSNNTAMGTDALLNLSGGYDNTGSGAFALENNTTGYYNTAVGYGTLRANTTGFQNTASGVGALNANTTGSHNTAIGTFALPVNTTGSDNTASGVSALQFNSTGFYNTATGYSALYANTTGFENTASGLQALHSNTSGSNNAAAGTDALYSNTTGYYNTASGTSALQNNTTGSNNLAEGYHAGYNLTTGNNNIDIGSVGVAGESDTIRIGTVATQRATYIAGVYGTSVSGSAVMVSSTGQLGVTVSSERFKTAIAPLAADSTKLQQLRPVSFRLKTDPHGALQYGLIAEEVAKVYPELVIRGDKGRIDGVRYDELAPLLLKEAQQQAAEIRDLKQQVAELKSHQH